MTRARRGGGALSGRDRVHLARLRVAVVINDLGAGGAQRAALDQAACLDPEHWQVEVASLELKSAKGWDTRLPRHVPVRRPGLAGLTGWLCSFAPDLVHAHLARASIACAVAAPIAGVAARVATCHNLADWEERRNHPVRLLARAALHRYDVVLAVSEAVRGAITVHDAALGQRTQVLWNGADLSKFESVRGMRAAAREVLGYRPGTFVVGAVARLDACKGLDLLLEAASLALHRVPGLEVLIVGDGPERARLVARSRELGLHARVRFVGEQSDVRPYLAAFDLFAAPSRSEGLGIAIVEALAAGVPVAGSLAGGIPEVLAGGEAGWLVDGSAHAWGETIVRAARAPAELARLAVAGLARADAFSIVHTRTQLEYHYEQALGGSEAPALDRAA